jgi:hypothetical protein
VENTLRKSKGEMSSYDKGTMNKEFHWLILRRIRKWRDFLEENRNLIQFNNVHPKIEQTQIHTRVIKGCNLVLTRNW